MHASIAHARALNLGERERTHLLFYAREQRRREGLSRTLSASFGSLLPLSTTYAWDKKLLYPSMGRMDREKIKEQDMSDLTNKGNGDCKSVKEGHSAGLLIDTSADVCVIVICIMIIICAIMFLRLLQKRFGCNVISFRGVHFRGIITKTNERLVFF